MKNLLRVLILVVLSVGLYLVVDLIITKGDNKLAMPELKSTSQEFGELTEVKLNESNCEIQKQTLSSFAFVDKEVNGLVEKDIEDLKKQASTAGSVDEAKKGAYINAIDTIKVNENLVSVRLTSMSKNAGETEFKQKVQLLNYDLSSKKRITLDDLFSNGYKAQIGSAYTDQYLLVHNGIEFFGDSTSTVTPYNNLKDYVKNTLLTSENLEVSNKEYAALTNKTEAKKTTEKATEKQGKDKKTETKTTEKATEKKKATETATGQKTTEEGKKPKKNTGKMVAFSFDDGPSKTNTDKILDLLVKYDCHATFFMLGQNASYFPEVVKRIHSTGNELANHTWDHQNLKKLSESEMLQEVNSAADEIESITGVRPALVRPPYGGFNDTVKATIKEPLIRWSVDSLDWQSRDPDQIVPLVLESVEDGDIILFHDIHETTTPAIERLLPALIEEGYQIVSVSELFAAKGIDINSQDLWYSAN